MSLLDNIFTLSSEVRGYLAALAGAVEDGRVAVNLDEANSTDIAAIAAAMSSFTESQPIVNQTGVGSWDGPWMDLRGHKFTLAQLDWAAAASTAGTLTMQASADPLKAAVNCYDITATLLIYFGTFTVAATAGSITVPLIDPWPYMRWRYASAGGGAASQFNGRLFLRR